MPTTRKMIKRDLSQAIGNIETAETYITRSGRLYEKDYPDLYQLFCTVLTVVTLGKEAVTNLSKQI